MKEVTTQDLYDEAVASLEMLLKSTGCNWSSESGLQKLMFENSDLFAACIQATFLHYATHQIVFALENIKKTEE